MCNHYTLRAQTILYKNDLNAVEKSVCSIANSVRVCNKKSGFLNKIELSFGDASPSPIIDNNLLDEWKKKYGDRIDLKYTFFGFNSGTSKGQNTLFKDCTTDYLMIYNPDIVVSPTYFIEMLSVFESDDKGNIGMVEARQIPIEHPKSFDFTDGSELWGAMACVIVPSEVYRQLGGLDQENFFMYCDDVDFSWRLRLNNKKVIFQPNASVFHGHRLDKNGISCPTEAELYYSVESALFMAYKWSNMKWLNEVINLCSVGTVYQKKALEEFNRREKAGTLPEQLDKEHKIAYFVDGCYSKNRY